MKVSDKTYDKLRFIAETFLPALTTLTGAILVALNVRNTEIIITIMAAIDTFAGEIVRKLRNNYTKGSEE